MAPRISDQRDIEFVLYEQLDAESLLSFDKYSEFNRKMFNLVIKEARTIATKEIFPTYTECDRSGVEFDNGHVTVPECLRPVLRLLVEGEWCALTEDPEYGGQGLPFTIAQAVNEYMIGANYIAMTYAILGHGAGKMIDLFGTDLQKKLFLKKLYTAEWGGTMLLTEPDAGSNVGALTTSARLLDDGTYEISGNKIFITNGEQNLTENIIHPVLARIEGAPAGTKGISLFIVPKIWVNEDGSLGGDNDVVCTGVEEKMGLHGSPTCSLSLGSKGRCRGYLLGEPNQGMKIMFHMMNEVRLEVGTQAFSSAACAYMHALDYAKQRHQGRSLTAGADHNAPQVPIIQHPDVRRMLLKMKAYVEGMRSLTYFTAFCFDQIECTDSDEEKAHFTHLVEILTPIVKAYLSEKGFDVCVEAMQVYGGYGYTSEFPVEQMVRDSKIASIYEGTNGIQAMDFLGRKLPGQKGAILQSLITEMKKGVALAAGIESLGAVSHQVALAVDKLETVCQKTVSAAGSASFQSAFAAAHPLLDATGDVIMAWMLLWRAAIAEGKLAGARVDKKDMAFYQGKVSTARFFIQTILPASLGKLDAVSCEDNPAVMMDEEAF